MTAPDVACFGEILWDLFEADAKPEKESTSSGIARHFKREIGGAAANVAVVLARLGVKVQAVGAVGADRLGEALRGALQAEGVDVSCVARLEARTGIVFVLRDAAGAPSFVPYRNGTADMTMGERDVGPSAAKVKWGVVSSTSLLPSARAATEKFVAALDKAKGALVVDLNARAHLWPDEASLREACGWLASRAAIIKASEGDLAAVAGKRGMTWLEENAKGASWILTRGENGAAALGAHGQVTSPTKRVRCVDTTGAGDAFVAGVLAVLLRAGAKPGAASFADAKLWSRALEVGHMLSAKCVSAAGATAGVRDLDEARTRIEGVKAPAAKTK